MVLLAGRAMKIPNRRNNLDKLILVFTIVVFQLITGCTPRSQRRLDELVDIGTHHIHLDAPILLQDAISQMIQKTRK